MTNLKSTTQYTITATHRITGKSRTTIQKHIKNGKLSCVEGAEGVKLIDASELVRVYGDECDFSLEGQGSFNSQTKSDSSVLLRTEVNTLEQWLETLGNERRREREQLQAQIDHLQEALGLAQEGQNRVTALLEDHSKAGNWQQAIRELEERFAKQERDAVQIAKEEAIEDFRNKPWWRLLSV